MSAVAVIRALCFIASGVLLVLLLFSALVSGTCGDGGAGAEGCAHFARTTLLIFGGGALVIGLVGVRLIGWEERRRDEEERAAERFARSGGRDASGHGPSRRQD